MSDITMSKTKEALAAPPNNSVTEQRKALADARARIIARYEQIDGWLKGCDIPSETRDNWAGITEGLRQARRIIGAMWDDLPVDGPENQMETTP